jgi:hypothetical protein
MRPSRVTAGKAILGLRPRSSEDLNESLRYAAEALREPELPLQRTV